MHVTMLLALVGVVAAVAAAGMAMSFYTDLPAMSFSENVDGALTGKEGYPVELVQGSLKIQAFNAGIYIGTLFERLEGSSAWKVQLRGRIVKAVAGGAINAPAYVKQSATGLVAANSGDKCVGIAIYPYVIAQGDQVSFIQSDCVMP